MRAEGGGGVLFFLFLKFSPESTFLVVCRDGERETSLGCLHNAPPDQTAASSLEGRRL